MKKSIENADEIAISFSGTVLYVPIQIGIKHVTIATSEWEVINTAPSGGTAYSIGIGDGKIWYWRP